MKTKQQTAMFFAVLAAALYAISAPISKLLLKEIPATMMAALLYLGAGIGLTIFSFVQKQAGKPQSEQPLTRKELPYTIGMVALDIAAPAFLMIGLSMTTAANTSLLNSFEIVATSVIALCMFKEAISKRLWAAIVLLTVSSIILSIEDMRSFSFSLGSIYVLLACVCWGFENNFTRMLSSKNPLQIVVIKGLCSGFSLLIAAVLLGETVASIGYILAALVLGFVAYGLSIFFYIHAQRELGAAKTSAYYAIAPFIGVALSLVILKEIPSWSFFVALLIMIVGTYFTATDGK